MNQSPTNNINENTFTNTTPMPSIKDAEQEVKQEANLEVFKPESNQTIANSSYLDKKAKIQDEAKRAYIAGSAITTANSPTKTELQSLEHTTRDEVMAALSLMDEDLNYTDTYTNYISNGGLPPQGYEQYSSQILEQERKERVFEDTSMSHQDQLLNAYGDDVLNQMGYNVNSIGWWMNKYQNWDFTSPYENASVMNAVLSRAEELHTVDQTKQYASKSLTTSKLSSIVANKEVTPQTVRELLSLNSDLEIPTGLSDKDLMHMITSDQISASQRVVTVNNTNYYIHHDGQIYELSNEKTGPNVATFKKDADGQLKEISVNGSELLDVGRSVISGAASVFTGLAKLASIVVTSPFTLLSKDYDIADVMNDVDSFFNDSEALNFLTDSGRVDLNGFQLSDAADISNMLGSVLGTVLGGSALSRIAGGVVNAGAKMLENNSSLGKVLISTGNFMTRSTGMFPKALGVDGKIAATSSEAFKFLGKVVTGPRASFLNHFAYTIPVYAMKDYMGTTQQLQNQYTSQILSGKPIDQDIDKKIASRALGVTTFNAMFSSVFAGGYGDNQSQRLAGLFRGTKKASEVAKGIASSSSTLKNVILNPKWTASLNTTMDFIDNFVTLGTSSAQQLSLSDKGEADISFWKNIDGNLMVQNAAQAAIMTIPTLKSQFQKKYMGIEQIGNVYKEVETELNNSIYKTSDIKNKSDLQAIKDIFQQDFVNSKETTVEGKYYEALSKLHDNLKDSKNESLVSKTVNSYMDKTVLNYYKDMSTISRYYFDKDIEAGIFKTEEPIKKGLANTIATGVRNKLSLQKSKKAGLMSVIDEEVYIEKVKKSIMGQYNKLTDSIKSQETLDKIDNIFKDNNLPETEASSYTTLDKRYTDGKIKADIDKAIDAYVTNYYGDDAEDIKEQVRQSSTVIRLKNETENRHRLLQDRATFGLLSMLMPDTVVKGSDNSYIIINTSSELKNAFVSDTANKLMIGTTLLKTNQKELGLDLITTTLLGDTSYDELVKNPKEYKNFKEVIYTYLQSELDNKAMSEGEISELFKTLSESKKPVAKTLRKIYEDIDITKPQTSSSDIDSLLLRRKAIDIITTIKNRKILTTEQQAALDFLYKDDSELTTKMLKQLGRSENLVQEILAKKLEVNEAAAPLENADSWKLFLDNVSALEEKEGLTEDTLNETFDSYVKSFTENFTGTPEEIEKKISTIKKLLIDQYTLLKSFKKKSFDGTIVTINPTVLPTKATKGMKLLVDSDDFTNEIKLEKGIHSLSAESKRTLDLAQKIQAANKLSYDLTKFEDRVELLTFLQDGEFISNPKYKNMNPEDISLDAAKHIISELPEDTNQFIRTQGVGESYDTGIIDDTLSKRMTKIIKDKSNKFKLEDSADIFYVDNNGRTSRVDLYTAISNSLPTGTVSTSMQSRFKRSGLMSFIPFGKKVSDSSGEQVFVTQNTGTKSKAFKAGGQGVDYQYTITTKAGTYELDQDLARETIILQMSNDIIENRADISFEIDASNKDKFYEVADKQNIYNKENNKFYYIEDNEGPIVSIKLKKDVTLNDLYKYVQNTKRFNLFILLPWVSDYDYNGPKLLAQKDLDGITIPSTMKANTLPGRAYNVIDGKQDWDQSGTVKKGMLKEFFTNANSGTYKYNPFTKNRETGDIISIYSRKYKKFFDENSNGEDRSNDFIPWVQNRGVLKTILDNSKLSIDEVVDEVVKYAEANIRYYGTPSADLNFKSFYSSIGGDTGNLNTAINYDVIKKAYGGDYILVENQAENYRIYDGAREDIERAINFVRSAGQTMEDVVNYVRQYSNNYILYKESDALKLRSIMGSSDNKIMIQDLDELYNLDMDAYIKYFDKELKIGHGKEIYNKVHSMYEKIHSINEPILIRANRLNKEQIQKEYRTSSSSTIRTPELKIGEMTLNENGELEPQKIQNDFDILYNKPTTTKVSRLKDFMSADSNSLLKELANSRYNTISKDFTNDKIGEMESLDIANGLNLAIDHDEIVKSKVKLNNILSKEGLPEASFEVAEKLYRQSYGSKYATTWNKFALFDPQTQDIKFYATSINSSGYKNNWDIQNKILSSDDLIGKVFIDMDKIGAQEHDGIKFNYKIIKTEEDSNNLKVIALMELFNQNGESAIIKKGLSNASDEIISEAMRRIQDNLLTEHIINNTIQNTANDIFKDLSGSRLLELCSTVDDYTFDTSKQKASSISDISSTYSDKDKKIINIARYGFSYDMLPQEKKNIINISQDILKNNIKDTFYSEGIPENDSIQIEKFIKAMDDNNIAEAKKIIDSNTENNNWKQILIKSWLATSKDDVVINSLIHKNSTIKNMKASMESNVDTNTEFKYYNSKETISAYELNNFFKYMNGEISSDTKPTISNLTLLDFETKDIDPTNIKSIEDAFQIGLMMYDAETKSVITKMFYIEHDNMTNAEWTKKYTTKYTDNKSNYFKSDDSKPWRDALDIYENHKYSSDQSITIKELGKLLKNQDIMIAFNGSKFDFKILQSIEGLENNKYLDAYELLKSFDINATGNKKLDTEVSRFSTYIFGGHHNAEEDTHALASLFTETIDNLYKYSRSKNELYNKISKLLDSDKDTKMISKLDTFLKQSTKRTNKEFDQAEVSLQDTSLFLRLLNHKMKHEQGRIFKDLEESVSNSTNISKAIDNDSYDNIVDIISAVAYKNNTDIYNALSKILNASYDITSEEPTSNKNKAIGLMIENNYDLLNKLELSTEDIKDFKSQDNYISIKNKFIDDLKTSKSNMHILSSKVNIPSDQLKKYDTIGNLDNFTRGVVSVVDNYNDIISKAKLTDDEIKLIKELENITSQELLTPFSGSESFDIHTLDTYKDSNRTTYVDKKTQKVLDRLEEITEADKFLSMKVPGDFTYMTTVDVDTTYKDIQEYTYDPITGNKTNNKKYLSDIYPTDIVMTESQLKILLNGKSVLEIMDDDGNIYISSMCFPSDGTNKLQTHRARIVNKISGSNGQQVAFTPIMQEILRQRDFDGDLSTVSTATKRRAGFYSKVRDFVYEPLTIVERVSKALRNVISYDNHSEIYKIQKDPEVIDVCKKMDDFLNTYHGYVFDIENDLDYQTLKGLLDAKIMLMYPRNDNETVESYNKRLSIYTKAVGLRHEFVGEQDEIAFVNNPFISTNSDYDYSFNARKKYFSMIAARSSAKGDQASGFYSKLIALEDLEDKKIGSQPLTKLLTPNISLGSTLLDVIDSIKTYDDAIKILNVFKTMTLESVHKLGVIDTMDNFEMKVDDVLTKAKQYINVGNTFDAEQAKRDVQSSIISILRTYNNVILTNEKFNKITLDALKELGLSQSELEKDLEERKRIIKLKQSILGTDGRYISGNMQSDDMYSETLFMKVKDSSSRKNLKQYENEIKDNSKLNVVVLMDRASDLLPTEDSIIVLPNSNKRAFYEEQSFIDNNVTLDFEDIILKNKQNNVEDIYDLKELANDKGIYIPKGINIIVQKLESSSTEESPNIIKRSFGDDIKIKDIIIDPLTDKVISIVYDRILKLEDMKLKSGAAKGMTTVSSKTNEELLNIFANKKTKLLSINSTEKEIKNLKRTIKSKELLVQGKYSTYCKNTYNYYIDYDMSDNKPSREILDRWDDLSNLSDKEISKLLKDPNADTVVTALREYINNAQDILNRDTDRLSEIENKQKEISKANKKSMDNTYLFDIDIDIVVDGKTMFKNPDKYSLEANELLKAFKNGEQKELVLPNGTKTKVIVLSNVPSSLLAIGSKYKPKQDVNSVLDNGYKEELNATPLSGMTIDAIPDTPIKVLDDGTIIQDMSKAREVKELFPTKGNVAHENAAESILRTRATMLALEMSDKDFNELSNGLFKTRIEYLTHLKKDVLKNNSIQIYSEILNMLNHLGLLSDEKKFNSFISKYGKIAEASFDKSFDRQVFLPLINTKQDEKQITNGIRSNNAKEFEANLNAYVSPGEIWTSSQRTYKHNNVIRSETYYIPMREYYSRLGISYNKDSLIDGVISGKLNFDRHYDDSTNGTDNGFSPLSIRRNNKKSISGDTNIVNNELKSSMILDTVNKVGYNLSKTFSKNDNVKDHEDHLPVDSQSIYSLLANVIDNPDSKYYGVSNSTKILEDLLKIYDENNKTKLSKKAALMNKDELSYALINTQFDTDNEGNIIKKSSPVIIKDKASNIMSRRDYNKYNYYTYEDLINKNKQLELDNYTKLRRTSKDIKTRDQFKQEYETKKNELKNKLIDSFTETEQKKFRAPDIDILTDAKGTTEKFKDSPWSRSGIKVTGEETLAIDTAIKNYGAYAEYYKEESMKALNTLKGEIRNVDKQQFKEFALYQQLKNIESTSPGLLKDYLDHHGIDSTFMNNNLKQTYETFKKDNGNFVNIYNTVVDSIYNLSQIASNEVGEPFKNSYMILMPYVSNDVQLMSKQIINNIKTMADISNNDPVLNKRILSDNLSMDFFKGSEKLINNLSRLAGISQVSNTLIKNGYISNTPILDNVFEILNDEEVSKDIKLSKELDTSKDILDIISQYSDINISYIKKTSKTSGEALLKAYSQLISNTKTSMEDFMYQFGIPKDELTLSKVYEISSGKIDGAVGYDATLAKKLYNDMWSQIILAQRILELSPRAMTKVADKIKELDTQGYSLVNKFGQRISMDSPIKPLGTLSLSYIKDNIEKTANSLSRDMFNQYLVEKALSGELYIAKSDMVNQLEKHVYTSKVPNKFLQLLGKVSKTSASIQMAMPAKMIGRLIRFTGFDYAMGAVSNPKVISHIPEATREIYQAVHTDGAVMSDRLKEYLIREGQPLGYTSKDPITYSEEVGSGLVQNITKKLTRPLEIQNHLGRYAIYLTALDGFNKQSLDGSEPWYGPVYSKKQAIDSLKSNEDKAMYIMDYLLGSPGGFPNITKKTNGLTMYSTFPMNLTRTMGAWGMSVGKLFSEGITSQNSKQWLNTIVTPSLGTAGLSMLISGLISVLADEYGVDEETEKKWKEECVSIDPLGTLIGESPSVVYDSINPAYSLKEMFINPLTNKYNNTLDKKVYGFIQMNILSKLNPAIKIPLEVISRKDLYGDSADQTNAYQYTSMENGFRKVLGFFVGSGIADNITNQFKMDQYNNDSSFSESLKKGIANGLSNDIGNQKSWKKNTSNYYAVINSIRSYNEALGTSYDSDYEDLLDANELYYSRNSNNKYGIFNKEDFTTANNMIKKMIKSNADATTIYSYIASCYNGDDNTPGMSEATLRSVLNSNSIIRKLNTLEDKETYLKTLSPEDKIKLQDAIDYERYVYPLFQEFFPKSSTSNTSYSSYYKIPYVAGSNRSYYTSRPDTYTPYWNNKAYSYYKKYKPYKSNYNKNEVKVSKEMGIWSKDYNQLKDLDVPITYLDNPYYNNLSEWDKTQKKRGNK
jgi:hypothetical protein